jgi:type I restriction enzyme S subunit
MTEWRRVTIGELVEHHQADVRTGPFGTQLHASDYTQTGVPVLNVRNLGYGGIRRVDVALVDAAVQERLSTHILRENDIVFGRKGAVDRHALIRSAEAGWMQGSDCIRLRLGEGSAITPAFLSMALLTPTHKAWMEAQCSHGATMASLNQEIISRIQLSVPDLASQNRIAAVLAVFDELITINERRIELLEDLARSLYREWFVRFRFPGTDRTTATSKPPSGWTAGRLGDVAEINGCTAKGNELPDPVRYVDISSVSLRRIEEARAISAAEAPGRARRRLRDGDTIWAMVRPNRRSHALVHDPPEDMIASTGFAVLSPTGVPAAFLFEYTSRPEFADYLVGRATGAAYPAVRPGDFEEAPLLIPPPDLLATFGELVDPALRLVSQLAAQKAVLARTRDLLLPRLVTGRLDIADIDLGDLLPAETAA